MTLKERIDTLVALGERLQQADEYLEAIMRRTHFTNRWFTLENQQLALQNIATEFLNRAKLESWLADYQMFDPPQPKTVGLVMAGNIPLVGFHDLLCVFVSGHRSLVKLSEKDNFLLPYLFQLLRQINPDTSEYFQEAPQLRDFSAVIATGSNNTGRYFEAYFGKYPNLIRKNRNGVAVLTDTETSEELAALGKDVFTYFGLGCRNVAKLYLPKGYDFDPLLTALHEYREIILHDKYKHNFDYNYALFILNREKHQANGCILLREDPGFQSRIATLHYEWYESPTEVDRVLQQNASSIQCVVARPDLLKTPTIPFGTTQMPGLADYPDGVDTLDFLLRMV